MKNIRKFLGVLILWFLFGCLVTAAPSAEQWIDRLKMFTAFTAVGITVGSLIWFAGWLIEG